MHQENKAVLHQYKNIKYFSERNIHQMKTIDITKYNTFCINDSAKDKNVRKFIYQIVNQFLNKTYPKKAIFEK